MTAHFAEPPRYLRLPVSRGRRLVLVVVTLPIRTVSDAGLQEGKELLKRAEPEFASRIDFLDVSLEMTLCNARVRADSNYKCALHLERSLDQVPEQGVEVRCFFGGFLPLARRCK